jgi:hypothetical protein
LQLAESKQRSNVDRIDAAIGSIWAVDEAKLMMEANNIHQKGASIMGDEVDKKDSSGFYYALDYEPPANGGRGDTTSEC